MKRLYASLLAISAFALSQAQEVSYTFDQPHGAWWTAPSTPELSLQVKNNSSESKTCDMTLTVVTDVAKDVVYKLTQSTTLAAGKDANIGYQFNLQPGFYHCIFTAGDSVITEYN
ncbi:MAG: hypothetical protein K2J74_07360, partial [Muribaculaceae bacterium]|nr:hypothetical protein [Muribaculaceae bacterium]